VAVVIEGEGDSPLLSHLHCQSVHCKISPNCFIFILLSFLPYNDRDEGKIEND